MNSRLITAILTTFVLASATNGQGVYYDVDSATRIEVDFCLGPCDCALPTLFGSASGTFTLVFDHTDPLFDVYRVEDAYVVSDIPDFQAIWFAGAGEYRIGGEVALVHQLVLDAELYGPGGEPLHFDSGLVVVDPEHPFPAIGLHIESERPELGCTQVRLDLIAAPDPCPADLDRRGSVDLPDLAILLGAFGQSQGATHADGDLDADHDVDLADLTQLLAAFGTRCP